MSVFLDGPAEGTSLLFARAPTYLRVVIGPDGKVDVLDQLEDEAAPDETIHVYRLVGGVGHVCVRHGKGRGCYQVGEYRHVPDVDGESVRDTQAWRATSAPAA